MGNLASGPAKCAANHEHEPPWATTSPVASMISRSGENRARKPAGHVITKPLS
jgi:hypothetical protein